VSFRKKKGDAGENLAVAHLQSLDYTILKRNFSASGGEVDIICKDGDMLVFVEVKTRAGRRQGEPAEAVGPAKQRRIIAAAMEYLSEYEAWDEPCRFDVIAVAADKNGRLQFWEHLQDAFDALSVGEEGYQPF
jgi:putative endonuclease